jgi:UrcA family protein
MLIRKVLKSNARLFLALAATVIASAPICSHADDSAPSRKVKYSHPTTPEGARHVYAQIERAANYACGTDSADLDKPGRCVREAIGRAIHDVNSPNLAQVYIEKNGMAEAHKFGISSDVMTAQR